ncbi:hypothetical protein [Halorarius halobius]|uniref:hypothetical protein n=1 Tax=Halorarius halobius TaxID=2962671 RepID=UPI0020CEA8F8|nr:hypothetical protein [Halorarius halobius]
MSGDVARRHRDAGGLDVAARAVLEFLEPLDVPVCVRTVGLNVGVDSATARAACHRLRALGLVAAGTPDGRGYVITSRGEDYLAGNLGLAAP